MNIHPGLLRAICEHPDDTGLRLFCADWWEEQGETERSEFVRVQCRLADLDWELGAEDCEHLHCPGCVERRELRHRERELVKKYGTTWVAEMFAEK